METPTDPDPGTQGYTVPTLPGPHREGSRRKSLLQSNELAHLPGHPPPCMETSSSWMEFRGLVLFSGLFYTNLLFMAWDKGFPCKAMTLMRLKNMLGVAGLG